MKLSKIMDRKRSRAGSGLASVFRPAGRDRTRNRLVPRLVPLEDRSLLTTFTVNSTLDNSSGTPTAGTLRWAVDQADLAGGNDAINFDPSVFGTPQTIALQQLLTPIELGGGASRSRSMARARPS